MLDMYGYVYQLSLRRSWDLFMSKAYYTILILYLIDELYRIKVIDIIDAYKTIQLMCIVGG